jgi:hypothetical protein
MILEDEHNEDLKIFEPSKDIQIRCKLSFANIKQGTQHIKNTKMHYQLTNDVMKH